MGFVDGVTRNIISFEFYPAIILSTQVSHTGGLIRKCK